MEIDSSGLEKDVPILLKSPWNECAHCENASFKTLPEFTRHLREKHCTIEGGSFTCHYGYNSVCNSLPVEGVSDCDYAEHVYKQHVLSQKIGEHEEGTRANKKLSCLNDHSSSLEHSIRWTIYSAKQNLATVLNDPNRGKQKDYFTKSWGLDFTEKNSSEIPKHPYLPDINRSHFESYFKKILKRHKRHLKLQEELNLKMVSSASNEVLQLFPKLRLKKVLSSDKKMLDKPQISRIFLQSDFDITNADTFYLIFPFSKEDKPENETFQHNRKVMQEKLTHDLDQVEVLIAEQVSQKSEAFFQAMTSHDSLMDQLASTLSVVQSLRQKISLIDKSLVKHSLFLIQLYRRKQNHITVLQKLKLMGTVQQTQPTIQALLSTPDYLAALELISTTQELLNEELKGIHSFRHLGSQLNEINRLIDMMMMTEFENYLARDLNRDLNQDVQVLEKEKLISIILGMLRRKNIKFILKYKEEIFTTIKTLVKQLVFEALADNDFDIDGPYTVEKVQLLSLSEWIDLINKITKRLIKFLNRVEAVVNIMKEAVVMAAGQTSVLSLEKIAQVEDDVEKSDNSKIHVDVNNEMCFLTVKECGSLNNDLKEVLVSACDFSNDECAKILTALAKNKSSKEKHPPKGSDRFLSNGSTFIFNDVDLKQIHRLSKIIEAFTIECEMLCSKTPTSLKSAFQHQAYKFLNKFHNDRKDRLNLILENECWRPAEIPQDFQTLIGDVSNFKTSLNKVSDRAKEGNPGTCLMVKNEKYVVVGSIITLIQLIMDYIDLAQNLPILGSSAIRSLAELLSHYNSRTCQLILGAGALHTVGLKTITTTNLVLTSRSLQLIIWLLPYIKYRFEGLPSLGNQINSNGSSIKSLSNTNINILNDVEVNIKDHISKLHAKVVLVVSNVVTNEVANWAAKPPVPSSSFRNISKHLAKLHEAVAGVLPSDQIQDLYKRIHESFKGALRDQLRKLNIVNNGGPQHGTVTSEMIFYTEMLKKLNIFESDTFFDHSLNDIWSWK